MPIEKLKKTFSLLSNVIYKSLMDLSDLNLKFIEQFVCRFKLNFEHFIYGDKSNYFQEDYLV